MVLDLEKKIREMLGNVHVSLVSKDLQFYQDAVAVLDSTLESACSDLGYSYEDGVVPKSNMDLKDGLWFRYALLCRFPALVVPSSENSYIENLDLLSIKFIESVKNILEIEPGDGSYPLILSGLYVCRTNFGESLNSSIRNREILTASILRQLSDINSVYGSCFSKNPMSGNIILYNLCHAIELSAVATLQSKHLELLQSFCSEDSRNGFLFSFIVDGITNVTFSQIAKSFLGSSSADLDDRTRLFFSEATNSRSTGEVCLKLENLWKSFRGEELEGIQPVPQLMQLGRLFWQGYLFALSSVRHDLFDKEIYEKVAFSHSARVHFNNILDALKDKELKLLLIISSPYLLFERQEVPSFFLTEESKIQSHSLAENKFYRAIVDLVDMVANTELTGEEFGVLVENIPVPCLDYFISEDFVLDQKLLDLSLNQIFLLPILEKDAIISSIKDITIAKMSGLEGLFARYICDYFIANAPHLLPKVNIPLTNELLVF